jgi:hypothetical protein
MQYYSAQDLARSFRTVRNNTIKIAEEIPEERYGFRAAPETRSVAETLAHIAAAPRWSKSMHTQRITHPDFATFRAGHEEVMKYQATLTTKAQILDGGVARRRRGVCFLASDAERRDPGRARVLSGGRPAAQQDALRDAAIAQGTRDAPSRPTDGGGAHGGDRSPPDQGAAGHNGRDGTAASQRAGRLTTLQGSCWTRAGARS